LGFEENGNSKINYKYFYLLKDKGGETENDDTKKESDLNVEQPGQSNKATNNDNTTNEVTNNNVSSNNNQVKRVNKKSQ
jgi:hypothetical protein